MSDARGVPDEQRVALGFRPRTVRGWWYWLRYWSWPALWWRRLVRGEWWW